MIGQSIQRFCPAGYEDEQDALFQQVIREGAVKQFETARQTEEGNHIPVEMSLSTYTDEKGNCIGVNAIIRDILERKQMEQKLKQELGEKSVLLKEVHHRVKNNLQIIISLLNMQSDKLKPGENRQVLQDALYRIGAISDAHEQLFKSSSLAKIAAPPYISRVVEKQVAISSSYDFPITVEKAIDDIDLSVETAVPLGLIVNELVTNTCKYAFPATESGGNKIEVELKKQNEHKKLLFMYRDNGIGIPAEVDIHNSGGLGFMLIAALTEQLEGKFELLQVDGFGIQITVTEQ